MAHAELKTPLALPGSSQSLPAAGHLGRAHAAAQSRALARVAFHLAMAVLDVVAFVGSAVGIALVVRMMGVAQQGSIALLVPMAAISAAIFAISAAARSDYQLSHYLSLRGHPRQIARLWALSVLGAYVLTTTTMGEAGVPPVGLWSLAAFFALAPLAVLGARAMAIRGVRRGVKTGFMPARRVFLIGTAQEIAAFGRTYQPWNAGLLIAGVGEIPVSDTFDDAPFRAGVERAAEAARRSMPDDVFVLAPWSNRARIEALAAPFLDMPVGLHLGPERILDRFETLHVSRFGCLTALSIARRPLSAIEMVEKRAFDLALAGLALVLLAPVLAVAALAIRLDSKGPALFRQKRFGFNQQPFWIFKLRTMTTMEDGATFTQARKGDQRITRVGAILRKYNIDELPQILNVLRGEMSIVGPRPHALAHDQEFERRIAHYARRLNVKPGITGWAQVNGYRGPTDTDDKMEKRVEFDHFYIENYSIMFDLKIIFMTVFSSKAYKNAH